MASPSGRRKALAFVSPAVFILLFLIYRFMSDFEWIWRQANDDFSLNNDNIENSTHSARNLSIDSTLNVSHYDLPYVETLEAQRRKLFDVPLIVHYVLLYTVPYPTVEKNSIPFVSCLSVLSVIQTLKPSAIYLHANSPDFWPFDTCNDLIKHWPVVKLIPVRRTFVMNGTRINRIEHEADLVKWKAVDRYGGLFLDFDVYVIDGEGIRQWLLDHPCIICHEVEGNGVAVNAGFFGCAHKHAQFPRMILQESYAKNFHPNEWIFNSGVLPLKFLRDHPEIAVLVDNVCNNPAWSNRDSFNYKRGHHKWTDRKAYHSFFHESSFTRSNVENLNSTLGDLLRWIMQGSSPAVLADLRETDLGVRLQDLVF